MQSPEKPSAAPTVETPAEQPHTTPDTVEAHKNRVTLEVVKMTQEQAEQRLAEVEAQKQELQARVEKESEGKGVLLSWFEQARQKLGALTAQEKQHRDALHRLDIELAALKAHQIKEMGPARAQTTVETVTVQPVLEGVADTLEEAQFFAQGDEMNGRAQEQTGTPVTMNDTPAHREYAKLIGNKQFELNVANGDEQKIAKIQQTYAQQEQALREQIQEEAATEMPHPEVAQVMARQYAEKNAPVPVTAAEPEEAEEPIPVTMEHEENTAPTEVLRPVVSAETPTEMMAETDENASAIAEEDPTPDNVIPFPSQESAQAQETPPDTPEATTNDTAQQKEIELLTRDKEALQKQLTSWGLQEVIQAIQSQEITTIENIKKAVAIIGKESGWPATPQKKGWKDRAMNMLFEESAQKNDLQPDMQTASKLLSRFRNMERAIAALNTSENEAAPTETKDEQQAA